MKKLSKKAMREKMSRIGSITSPLKAKTARENGKKGGRPRKKNVRQPR